jgi:hypothetical protein
MKWTDFLLIGFLILVPSLPGSALSIESGVEYGDWGFDNDRTAYDTGIDRINIRNASITLSTSLFPHTQLSTGYRYSSIVESQMHFELFYERERITLAGGVFLGFLNENPFDITPGISARARVGFGEWAVVDFSGNTSLFIHPLVSLSPPDFQIDQNRLSLSGLIFIRDAALVLSYENENLKAKNSAGDSKENSRDIYELAISTEPKNFWISSHTAIGAEIEKFEINTVLHKFIGGYLKETVTLGIHNIDLSLGLKATVLNSTLEALKSSTPPQTPWLSLSAGLRWTK